MMSQMSIKQEMHSGPIPSPSMMREYENICPGACDRLIGIYEKQVNHRTSVEEYSVKNEYRFKTRGQWFGFILSIVFGLIGAFLAYICCYKLAGVIFTTLIVTLAYVFVLNKKPSDKDNQ